MHKYRIQATDIHTKFQSVGSDDPEQVSGEGFRLDPAAILSRKTIRVSQQDIGRQGRIPLVNIHLDRP